MFCRKCGKALLGDTSLCVFCGTWTNAEQPKKSNGMAIAGFVCSFISSLLGWTFGGIGLAKAQKLDGKGTGLSIAALIISNVHFAISCIIMR